MLASDGHRVVVFERKDTIFSEASGNNQFRLHMGLHYARSSITRHQTRDGYHRFIERYPRFTKSLATNLYLVPRNESLMDYETYVSIMLSSGIKIHHESVKPYGFLRPETFEGAVRCDERVLLTSVARNFFRERLAGSLRLNADVGKLERVGRSALMVCGEKFEHVVDATWGGHENERPGYFFESTVLYYYKLRPGVKAPPAVTLVDGNLWSLYPTEDPTVFTLSHVSHTPVLKSSKKSEAMASLTGMSESDLAARRDRMVKHVLRHIPQFHDMFEYVGPQFSVKMKPIDESDQRACIISTEGRLTRIVSGKVDNIFHASDHLLGLLSDR